MQNRPPGQAQEKRDPRAPSLQPRVQRARKGTPRTPPHFTPQEKKLGFGAPTVRRRGSLICCNPLSPEGVLVAGECARPPHSPSRRLSLLRRLTAGRLRPSASSECIESKMSSICSLARKFTAGMKSSFERNTIFDTKKIRNYSVSRFMDPPKTCFIMGRYGKVVFPGDRWQSLADFLDKNPILEPIPSDELYIVDQAHSCKSNDVTRLWMKTGLYFPYFSKQHRKSYSGIFSVENIGIIKDLGVMAVREPKEDAGGKWLLDPTQGYREYCDFLQDLIRMRHPSFVGCIPLEIKSFFSTLSDPNMDEEFALDSAALLSDVEYADILIDVWKILRRRYPQTDNHRSKTYIIRYISTAHLDCLRVCQNHPILNAFLPEKLRYQAFIIPRGNEPVSVGTGNPSVTPPRPIIDTDNRDIYFLIGMLLVDTHRIGSAHSDDRHLRHLLETFFPKENSSNLKKVALGGLVIKLLRHELPLYLPAAFLAFWTCSDSRREWMDLGIRFRNPILSIYFAESERYIKFLLFTMAKHLASRMLLAQQLKVKPNASSSGAASGGAMKLHVRNLHASVTADQLRLVFEPFGHIELGQLPIDPLTGLCLGFAFVQFNAALSLNDQFDIAGQVIQVSAVTDGAGEQVYTVGPNDDEVGGLARNASSREINWLQTSDWSSTTTSGQGKSNSNSVGSTTTKTGGR